MTYYIDASNPAAPGRSRASLRGVSDTTKINGLNWLFYM